MENLSGRLTLFHNLYLGCLIGMFICLVIAVILFIRLDIRNVIAFWFYGITITKRLEDGTEQTTEILPVMSSEEKTTLLKQELPNFHIEREILMIHTEEIIA